MNYKLLLTEDYRIGTHVLDKQSSDGTFDGIYARGGITIHSTPDARR